MAKFLNFNFSLSDFFDKVDAFSPAHLVVLAVVATAIIVAMLGLTHFANKRSDVMKRRRNEICFKTKESLPQTSLFLEGGAQF